MKSSPPQSSSTMKKRKADQLDIADRVRRILSSVSLEYFIFVCSLQSTSLADRSRCKRRRRTGRTISLKSCRKSTKFLTVSRKAIRLQLGSLSRFQASFSAGIISESEDVTTPARSRDPAGVLTACPCCCAGLSHVVSEELVIAT